MNSSNISINEFNQKLTKKIRERILVYSVLILSPLFILIFLYSDFRTNALALDPISNQALQGISLGDAISIDRASKATLFLPRALFSKIILSDGTCISFFEKTSEIWEDKVTASCHEFRGELYYPLTKKLVDSQGENIGVMVVGFAFPWIYLVFIPIFILISSLLIYYIVRNSAIHGINRITKIIEDFPLMIKSEIPEHFEIAEIENAYLEIVRLRNVEVEHVKFSALHRLAQQVSHDIASPLSALEMVSSQLASLPEDTRIIIRNSINRIRDISHSLLKKDKGKTFLNSTTLLDREEGSSSEVTLLSPVLESVIAEKRVQYRDYLKINIFFDQTRESYGLFSKIDIVDFTRSISNLINNSIEALPKSAGKIDLVLKSSGGSIKIQINDNGKGIPAEVVKELGVRGVTFEKENGSGLGLAHAKEVIESFGGSLRISSELGVGTSIIITLVQEAAPGWFVPSVNVKTKSKVVIFDDDQSIHQIWKGRFESAMHAGDRVELIHFSNPNELRQYYRTNFADLNDVLFLMDYEILNHSETGLDLIETLGIQSQSILVTSRYDEASIRNRCEALKVRLIPKPMSGFVPIEVSPT